MTSRSTLPEFCPPILEKVSGSHHTEDYIFRRMTVEGLGHSSLSYCVAHPAPALREVIILYTQTEAEAAKDASSQFDMRAQFLPTDSTRMIFCYHDRNIQFRDDRTCARATGNVIGPHDLNNACRTDNIRQGIRTLNVRFKPGGFYRLFGVSPLELRNSCFGVDDILGSEGRTVEDLLNNSDSLEDRINILDEYFIARLKAPPSGTNPRLRMRRTHPIESVLELIKRRNGKIRVGDLAEATGVARRTMESQFLNFTGISPKEYSRIARFNHLLDDVLHGSRASWTEFAASHGYYDQMHMIKEFKAATSMTPSAFKELRGTAFFTNVGLLAFINPSHKQPPFMEDWIEASVRMEEDFRAFMRSYHQTLRPVTY